MKKILFILLIFCLLPVAAKAQFGGENGIKSFQQDKDLWRRKTNEKVQILTPIEDSIGKSAAQNISDAEQIFCYYVEAVTPDYNGYTIDGMAIKSYCGNIDSELKDIVVLSLFGTESNISNKKDNCIIRPRLMLRFVRGVDYTDVLLSSPCYSFTIFYAGKVKSYNFTPGAEIIDTLIKDFSARPMPFVSPSLLGQVLPVGIPQTAVDNDKINAKSKTTGPVRSWEREETSQPSQKGTGGWNNLSM